jgi:hypothetical protein
MSLPIVTDDIPIAPSPSVEKNQAVRRRPRTSTAPTPIATTPMTAISSMSAPVKARPPELVGVVVTDDVVAAGPSAGALAGEVVMPVVGVVHPV